MHTPARAGLEGGAGGGKWRLSAFEAGDWASITSYSNPAPHPGAAGILIPTAPKLISILPPLLEDPGLTSREGGSEVMKEGKAPALGDWVGGGDGRAWRTSSPTGGGGEGGFAP